MNNFFNDKGKHGIETVIFKAHLYRISMNTIDCNIKLDSINFRFDQ